MPQSPSITTNPDEDARDFTLVSRMRENDPDALRDLMHHHALPMKRIAMVATQRLDLAQEAVQTVFARVWTIRDNLPTTGSIKSYLYRAARNEALNLIRHEKSQERMQDSVTSEYAIHPPVSYNDGEAKVIEEEYDSVINKLLNSLQPQVREVFLMRRIHGMSYEEIAAVLEVSVVSVRSQMSRAVRRIAEALKEAGL